MNCKPGDLAIVVRSRGGVNLGRIVKCVRPVKYWFIDSFERECWITEPMLTNVEGKMVPCPDACLRPIRPGDLEDETPNVRELEAA